MSNNPDNTFDAAVEASDELIRQHTTPIWVGAEPTFTDRYSDLPEWLTEALGATKRKRARRLMASLHKEFGEGLMLRTLGKQYPKEPVPRWSYGFLQNRLGEPIWKGPQDPLLLDRDSTMESSTQFWQCLTDGLKVHGRSVAAFSVPIFPRYRIAICRDGRLSSVDPNDPRLARPSLHAIPTPVEGLRDKLAEEGLLLIAIDWIIQDEGTHGPWPYLELPAFAETEFFLDFLDSLAHAANAAQLKALILAGFPPPVDASLCWTTITPDPAVVEVNMAPARDLSEFLRCNRILFRVANALRLSPYRFHYNGQVGDSGGGGQITIGGPTPQQSPFLTHPRLLPNLIRYLNRHPALSYYFASPFIGSTSQSPRPDEGPLERFEELRLALHLIDKEKNLTPEMLWRSLAPFLTDPGGNTHRSEINIEKLWNPYLPGRGCLGLVEFRALRMPATPERATALAALLRGVLLMLARCEPASDLVNWRTALHDRFALPFFLRWDLCQVFDDLTDSGCSLGQPIVDQLLDDRDHVITEVSFQDCRLILKQALEFWPVIGDTTTQEQNGSRLVDASTARLEVCIRCETGEHLANWELSASGYRVPLQEVQDWEGPGLVFGLRYRRFNPEYGFHPTLDSCGPIQLILSHKPYNRALTVRFHEWKPGGGPYDGLPADFEEAYRRRSERAQVEIIEGPTLGDDPLPPPEQALTPYCMDLRWL